MAWRFLLCKAEDSRQSGILGTGKWESMENLTFSRKTCVFVEDAWKTCGRRCDFVEDVDFNLKERNYFFYNKIPRLPQKYSVFHTSSTRLPHVFHKNLSFFRTPSNIFHKNTRFSHGPQGPGAPGSLGPQVSWDPRALGPRALAPQGAWDMYISLDIHIHISSFHFDFLWARLTLSFLLA